MALRLLLVRHGLSSFNRERRIQGRNDLSTLTPEGQAQAIRAGEAIANVRIHHVYCSPLQRAASTATNILNQRKDRLIPNFNKNLLEIELGSWSGMTSEEVKLQFPETYKTWRDEPERLSLRDNNGKEFQPLKLLTKQAQDFLKEVLCCHSFDQDETILVVAHNAILRCLILELIGQPNSGFRRLQLDNASISTFNLSSGPNKNYKVQVECLNSTSHLDPNLPAKRDNARIILVRHGETDWNLEGRFQGQIDIPLNKNGHSQANAAKDFLGDVKFNRAYSSSMTRPKQTAELIIENYKDLDLELKDNLVEISHGLWEGKLESEVKLKWEELLEKWKNSPQRVQMPNGETIQDVWERSVNCWEEIANQLSPNETVLVVAHDAVNKTILCHLLGLTASDIWMIKQGNGAVTVIDISTQNAHPHVVTCLNLTSHLGGLLDSTAQGAL